MGFGEARAVDVEGRKRREIVGVGSRIVRWRI